MLLALYARKTLSKGLVNSDWRDAFLPISPTDVGNGDFQTNGVRMQTGQALRELSLNPTFWKHPSTPRAPTISQRWSRVSELSGS
ncbi:hypothetical protein QFZ94_008777 [Paraburkholderia sp. JPY465]